MLNVMLASHIYLDVARKLCTLSTTINSVFCKLGFVLQVNYDPTDIIKYTRK